MHVPGFAPRLPRFPASHPFAADSSAVRACLSIGLTALLCGSVLAQPTTARADEAPAAEQTAPAVTAAHFSEQVLPILQKHCLDCHGADLQEGQLRLDSLPALIAGGKSGPPIVPGKADESLLIAAVRYRDEALQMPPDGKLSDAEITALTEWVAGGAPHPDGPLTFVEPPPPFDPEQARQFWAFQPPQEPTVPTIAAADLVYNPIDAFVVQQLTAAGLQPNAVADRRTLIRRATLDLIGLPPTPEEVDAFLADPAPDAFARVIDRLLESPHYGERWARHWLDVVRYADSNGLDENVAHGNAFRYRDYVIGAFNADKPINQFLKEQLAGDLLITDQTDLATRHQLLTATGFLSLGPKVLAEADKTKMLMDILDEQIDTTGRAFLALTFGCARCHNHKFDPVSQADYYALAGIFKSTHTMDSLVTIAKWHEHTIATPAEQTALENHQAAITAKKSEITTLIEATRATLATGAAAKEEEFPEDVRQRLQQLRDEQKQLEASVPELPTAMGVREGTPESTRINIRGSHLTLGRTVSRGIPVVLQSGHPLEIQEGQSGRRQLAEWLTDPQHPLTARVFVNRVWRWHFGRGLVASVDNFGHLGERPSHPELLDWLALQFQRTGWSLKALHRTILLSRTWQQSSDPSTAADQADPDNVLLWKFTQQRMDAEVIRDSVLAVSGLLDRSMGGSLLHVKNREFLFNHTSKDETRYDAPRRSIYLPVIRNNLYDGFSLFDCTDAAVPNGNRATSTVASQALFMMNSDLLLQAAEALASRLLQAEPQDSAQRLQQLFRRTLGRPATEPELQILQQHAAIISQQLTAEAVPAQELEARTWAVICQSLLASNEFMYVR